VTVPESTVTPVEAPTNADAKAEASHYEICDRTGFRVRPGGLKEEWNGLKVRPESWERRNQQDFLRGKAEHPPGSERPEQVDRFIADVYPNDVSPDDL